MSEDSSELHDTSKALENAPQSPFEVDVWCDEHWSEVIDNEDVDEPVAGLVLGELTTGDNPIYRTAYKLKNDTDDFPEEKFQNEEIPEDEWPEHDDLRDAVEEHAPICCHFEEHGKWEDAVEAMKNSQMVGVDPGEMNAG